MDNWKQISVAPDLSLIKVMEVIDKGAKQIALVTEENFHLLGTVTDGDIRRAIIRGAKLDSPIIECMNTNPLTGLVNENPAIWQRLMQKNSLHILPVLDSNGCIEKLVQLELPQESVKENNVIIMAGGLGKRLQPLTKDNPKPLLKIGNRPILETIIRNFTEQGYYKFTLSINYHGEKIKNYFKDGRDFNVQIRYIEEKQRLGTAGSLSLLNQKPDAPFIVMNGDILTKVDFNRLIEFHEGQKNKLTLCTREYNYQVPYGVVEQTENKIQSIKEKPKKFYNINAGIYIIEPEVLKLIPNQEYYDMTQLIDLMLSRNLPVGSFQLTDYWLDIGRMEDFDRAHIEFNDFFE